MKKISIVGLLNLNALFLFDKFNKNFENTVNAAYKINEDGANSVVVWGNTFKTRLKVYEYLKGRLDIPVVPFVSSETQFAEILNEKRVFAKKDFPETIFALRPKSINFLEEKISDAVLITNKDITKVFKTTPDFIPEYATITAFRLCELSYKFLITEEVLSARKGTKLCKKLF